MSSNDPRSPHASGGQPEPPRYGQPMPPPPASGTPGPAGQVPPPPQAPGSAPTPPAYGQGQNLPSYGQMGSMPPAGYTPPAPPSRPSALDAAVKLMQAGGVLSLLNLLTVFLFRDEIREAAEKAAADAGGNVDIDAVVNVGIAVGVVSGLLGAALWFWMAAANGKGKSWARIVASIFYGISLLSIIFAFTQPQSAVSRVLALVSLAIGTGAMVMMWKKESSAYYDAMSRPGM